MSWCLLGTRVHKRIALHTEGCGVSSAGCVWCMLVCMQSDFMLWIAATSLLLAWQIWYVLHIEAVECISHANSNPNPVWHFGV